MSRGINPTVSSVCCVSALICLLCLPLAAFGQAEEDSASGRKYRAGSGPAGLWMGEVKDAEGEKHEITLQLDKDGDQWLGQLTDPFEGSMPASRLSVTPSRIGFTFRPEGAPFPAHFSGIYLAGDDRISGTISRRGGSVLIKFKRDPDSIQLPIDELGEPIIPARVRHPHRFAVSGRYGVWPALHVVKAEQYNINTLTSRATAMSGAIEFFLLDEFNLFFQMYRGGQNFTDDAKIQSFSEIGLTSDSYQTLDGWEFGVSGYFGNLLLRDSKFNPYLTGAVGKSNWELNSGERGTRVVEILDKPVEGTDWAFAIGIGTEYEITTRVCLEFEYLWRYFLTEDEVIWEFPDEFWSNTHAWSFTAGVTIGIW